MIIFGQYTKIIGESISKRKQKVMLPIFMMDFQCFGRYFKMTALKTEIDHI